MSIELVETLLAIHHFGKDNNNSAIKKLKANKMLLANGKISKLGEKFTERWYESGSNRTQLMKEISK